MGSYYEHTRTESTTLPYSFRCEQCGQESGFRKVTVTGEAKLKNYQKQLSNDEENRLYDKAHEDLVKQLKGIRDSVTQKKIVPADFSDDCPHCHMPQSWGIAVMKKKMLETPITCFVVGIVFALLGLFVHYFGDMEYVTIPIILGIFAVGTAAAVITLVWNIVKINSKVKKTSSGMQGGFPVFDWGAVQKFLDEN